MEGVLTLTAVPAVHERPVLDQTLTSGGAVGGVGEGEGGGADDEGEGGGGGRDVGVELEREGAAG